ncbi:MAG: hypothetical protein OEZ39_19240 [Gammaproteobacteria bacterium]|nr:hypothetical protein [Gammaproteobacteria bacterium]MDH5654001.1 hypothetical protein [Gammaproteobacteria bacterium]
MKKNNQILLSTTLISGLLFGLTSCGGGGGGFTGDGIGAGQITGEYNIEISYPNSEAITKLQSEAGGFYSMSGAVLVTDRNGNPPPKGSIIHLDAIDTIKAFGLLDNITGAVITDANPTLADGSATFFNTAKVIRDFSDRYIEANDIVLLVNNADPADKVRFIKSITANTITTTSSYSQVYPGKYAAGTTTYLIGSSDIGVKINGIDPDEPTKKLGAFTKTDISGIGKFRIEYPARPDTIFVGSIAGDTRYDVTGSADVFIIARSSDNSVATIDGSFAFAAIKDLQLSANPTTLGGNANIRLTLTDKEFLLLPYMTITASSSDSGVVTVDGAATSTCVTDDTSLLGEYGICEIAVVCTGAAGETATIDFVANADSAATASTSFTCP